MSGIVEETTRRGSQYGGPRNAATRREASDALCIPHPSRVHPGRVQRFAVRGRSRAHARRGGHRRPARRDPGLRRAAPRHPAHHLRHPGGGRSRGDRHRVPRRPLLPPRPALRRRPLRPRPLRHPRQRLRRRHLRRALRAPAGPLRGRALRRPRDLLQRALRGRVLPHALRGRDLPRGAVLRHRQRAVRGHSALRRRVPRGLDVPRHVHPAHRV